MICFSEKRFFTSNLVRIRDWTPNPGATRNRGASLDARQLAEAHGGGFELLAVVGGCSGAWLGHGALLKS